MGAISDSAADGFPESVFQGRSEGQIEVVVAGFPLVVRVGAEVECSAYVCGHLEPFQLDHGVQPEV